MRRCDSSGAANIIVAFSFNRLAALHGTEDSLSPVNVAAKKSELPTRRSLGNLWKLAEKPRVFRSRVLLFQF